MNLSEKQLITAAKGYDFYIDNVNEIFGHCNIPNLFPYAKLIGHLLAFDKAVETGDLDLQSKIVTESMFIEGIRGYSMAAVRYALSSISSSELITVVKLCDSLYAIAEIIDYRYGLKPWDAINIIFKSAGIRSSVLDTDYLETESGKIFKEVSSEYNRFRDYELNSRELTHVLKNNIDPAEVLKFMIERNELKSYITRVYGVSATYIDIFYNLTGLTKLNSADFDTYCVIRDLLKWISRDNSDYRLSNSIVWIICKIFNISFLELYFNRDLKTDLMTALITTLRSKQHISEKEASAATEYSLLRDRVVAVV